MEEALLEVMMEMAIELEYERRIRGKRGEVKTLSPEEETEILREFGEL